MAGFLLGSASPNAFSLELPTETQTFRERSGAGSMVSVYNIVEEMNECKELKYELLNTNFNFKVFQFLWVLSTWVRLFALEAK